MTTELLKVTHLMMANRLAEAETICHEYLSKNAHSPDALHLLGHIVFQRGDLERSLKFLHDACEIAPMIAEIHNSLGGVLCNSGRHEEALDSLRQATRLKPSFAAAHNSLGAALA